MKLELEQKLMNKYPKIFIGRNKSVKESLIPFGLECGNGWYKLIDNLCASIRRHIDAERYPPKKILQVEATQVKEKFGGLRFYYTGGDELIEGMIKLAERLSYVICENCSSMENVTQTKGWIVTLCDKCMVESKED